MASAALSILVAACQSVDATPRQAQPAAPILSSHGDAFIGLGGGALTDTLGAPDMVRRESPAEVWQYDGATCVVDFYFYDVGGGGMEVVYVEARDMQSDSEPAERCVNALLQSVAVTAAPSAPQALIDGPSNPIRD